MATLTFVVKVENENGISYWFVTAGLSVTDTNTETNTDKVKYKCRWKYKTKVATVMFALKVANVVCYTYKYRNKYRKSKKKCRWNHKYKTKQKVATVMFAAKVANEAGIWYRFVAAGLFVGSPHYLLSNAINVRVHGDDDDQNELDLMIKTITLIWIIYQIPWLFDMIHLILSF